MHDRQTARRDDQAAVRSAREGRDAALDLGGIVEPDRIHLHPEGWGDGLDGAELSRSAGVGWISQNSRSRHAWGDLLEQLQPFRADVELEIGEPGSVAVRSRHAADKAAANRVGDLNEHDRYRTGRLLQRPYLSTARGQDDIRRERDQFPCIRASAIRITSSPAVVNAQIAIDDPSPIPAASAGMP